MTEYEIEFYAYLGLLSVKFAQMEYKLSTIIGKLFGTDDDLIAITVIEKNSLSKNIDLLRDLNRIRQFQYSIILDLTEQIGKIKGDRNLFIHGIWGNPVKSKDSIIIICDEKKIRYNEEKDKQGNIVDQTWHFNKNHIFKLIDIKNRIRNIDTIITLEDRLIKGLEDEHFI